MDLKDLKTLIKMVTDTDITEFEMENSEQKIVIRRRSSVGVIQPVEKRQNIQVAEPIIPVASSPPAQEVLQPPETVSKTDVAALDGEEIKSPIVGTFYRAPSPESAPYVEVGAVVEKI